MKKIMKMGLILSVLICLGSFVEMCIRDRLCGSYLYMQKFYNNIIELNLDLLIIIIVGGQ